MKRTARAIRLDKGYIKEVSQELESQLGKIASGTSGSFGEQILIKGHPFSIRTVDGKKLPVWVRVMSRETRSQKRVLSGALGSLGDKTVVVVFVNGSMAAEENYGETAGVLAKQLYPVLLHELTHAAEQEFIPKNTKSEQESEDDRHAYYNITTEVNAYMQEVVDEVEERFKHWDKFLMIGKSPGKALSMLVGQSDTWAEVSPFWTDKNKNRVLKAVSQALADWQEKNKTAALAASLVKAAKLLLKS